MKIENSTLSKRLKQYSALAGSILATTGLVKAQVVYTDITDVTLNATANPGETYALDLNNDGTVDYRFRAIRYTASNKNFIGVVPFPYYSSTNFNAIAGDVQPGGGNFYGYPYALSLNENIDSNLNFFNLVDLINTLNQFYKPIMFSDSDGDYYGYWQGGVTDHYVAFKFLAGGDGFFGWARCDVADDASSITIKDYAYNSTHDVPLLAGEGALGVASFNESRSFTVFAYEGVLNVYVKDGTPDGTVVTVTNMLGESIMKHAVTNRDTRIDLNQFAKGIYTVTVQRGEEVLSKKISFR